MRNDLTKKGWTTVSLPEDLISLIDDIFKKDEFAKKLYKNRTAFIIDSIRRRIEEFMKPELKK